MTAEVPGGVCVFSPGVRLTVTVEIGPRGEEIHLHPGGQGYWLARSMERLGMRVVLCATVGGEVGDVVTPLLRSHTGIELVAVEQAAPSPVTMYDRRSGTRTLIARSEPASIDRHAVDKLYSLTLAHAIGRGCCVLAGNIDTGTIPPAYYGRLGADLNTLGVPIIADLHGPELDEILGTATVQLIKVSDEDLRDDGAISDDLVHGLGDAVDGLARRTAHDLVVTRGPDRPAVARIDDRWYRVAPPRLAAVDWRGSGDAMAGAMAVGYARELTGAALLRFGAAAGAASVTRRGLASLDAELVDALAPRVAVDEIDDLEHVLSS
jgi:1-phosphofructokinase